MNNHSIENLKRFELMKKIWNFLTWVFRRKHFYNVRTNSDWVELQFDGSEGLYDGFLKFRVVEFTKEGHTTPERVIEINKNYTELLLNRLRNEKCSLQEYHQSKLTLISYPSPNAEIRLLLSKQDVMTARIDEDDLILNTQTIPFSDFEEDNYCDYGDILAEYTVLYGLAYEIPDHTILYRGSNENLKHLILTKDELIQVLADLEYIRGFTDNRIDIEFLLKKCIDNPDYLYGLLSALPKSILSLHSKNLPRKLLDFLP